MGTKLATNAVLGILQVVSDLDKMVPFYTDVLKFVEKERTSWPEDVCEQLFKLPNTRALVAKLQLGDELLYLIQFTPNHGQPHLETFSYDLWFQHIAIVVSDMERAYAKLREKGVSSISETYQSIPQSNTAASGIQAFYFKSPDGHPLELIYYPQGKGNAKWQNKDSLFLGIDHTAIVVSNTKLSTSFYHELFKMDQVGESLNFGEEQDKLANLFSTKVRITSFAYPQGMAVEFLEYLSPEGGRKHPRTEMHNLIETQTIVAVDSLELLELPSVEMVRLPKELADCTHAATLTDPDGHRILLLTKK